MSRHQLALEPRLGGLARQADHLAGDALVAGHAAAGIILPFVRQLDLTLRLARRQREGQTHAGRRFQGTAILNRSSS